MHVQNQHTSELTTFILFYFYLLSLTVSNLFTREWYATATNSSIHTTQRAIWSTPHRGCGKIRATPNGTFKSSASLLMKPLSGGRKRTVGTSTSLSANILKKVFFCLLPLLLLLSLSLSDIHMHAFFSSCRSACVPVRVSCVLCFLQ